MSFNLSRAYNGTCHLTIAASQIDYASLTVAVNGNTGSLVGYPPGGSDSTLNRQASVGATSRVLGWATHFNEGGTGGTDRGEGTDP